MSINICPTCGKTIDEDFDVEHYEECKNESFFMNWLDPSGELQGKFDNMMKSADRIIARGKQIKEMDKNERN